MTPRIDFRIIRARTPAGNSIMEALERFASLEGRTLPNAVEYALGQGRDRWADFLHDFQNPGKATT